ncbi:SRPBCC family protein [Mycobacterium sp. SM1]|uniref:SRPBCC family protein n=1 Tax=Mycobacterium sp. SM1 TaxID=2816243 RepID=UPI001BCF34F5|nr:SRPBCC family protein [Mycobacterium sp. SM1]MBS4727485.1 SRPBCC family protein [Mycobacterium sp. SM1]
MAISESREVVIEASPEEVLDVIADLESLPEWSSAHQSAEVIATGEDGRPTVARMKVKVAGITDEQVVAYTWGDNTVSWTLVSATRQRSQDAAYTVTPEGQGTRVRFDITVEPLVPLPGFLLKRAVNAVMDTATAGLRTRVLGRKSNP